MTQTSSIAGPVPGGSPSRGGKIQSVSWRTIVLLVAPLTDRLPGVPHLSDPPPRHRAQLHQLGHSRGRAFHGGRGYQLLMKDFRCSGLSVAHDLLHYPLSFPVARRVGVRPRRLVRLKWLRNTALAPFFPTSSRSSVVTQYPWLWVLDRTSGLSTSSRDW